MAPAASIGPLLRAPHGGDSPIQCATCLLPCKKRVRLQPGRGILRGAPVKVDSRRRRSLGLALANTSAVQEENAHGVCHRQHCQCRGLSTGAEHITAGVPAVCLEPLPRVLKCGPIVRVCSRPIPNGGEPDTGLHQDAEAPGGHGHPHTVDLPRRSATGKAQGIRPRPGSSAVCRGPLHALRRSHGCKTTCVTRRSATAATVMRQPACSRLSPTTGRRSSRLITKPARVW